MVPDDDMMEIIESRFGRFSYVMKKYRRMMYWMPKFKTMNPYPIPWILPNAVSTPLTYLCYLPYMMKIYMDFSLAT